MTCSGIDQNITVKLVEIADGGNYRVTLIPGVYQLVATSYGRETMVVDDVTVEPEGSVVLAIDL